MTELCIANIDRGQRRLRAGLGLLSFAVAALIAVAPELLGLDPRVRYAALPFVFGGMAGVLQHREKT